MGTRDAHVERGTALVQVPENMEACFTWTLLGCNII